MLSDFEYRDGQAVSMTTLVVTGDVEACLQSHQWRANQSFWQYLRFSELFGLHMLWKWLNFCTLQFQKHFLKVLCSSIKFWNVQKCILIVIMSRPYIKNIVLHCLDFFILVIAMLSVIVDYMVRYGCYDVLSKQLCYIYISYFDDPLYLVAFFY